MQKFLYRSLFIVFIFVLLLVFYKSELQNLGEQRNKYLKYYIFLGSLFFIFVLGFFLNKTYNLIILITSISLIFSLYFFESYTLFSIYINQKNKENLYYEKSNKKYDKRSLVEYLEFRKKTNKDIKVAIYPDYNNQKKNLNIFPLSGISNKETILCNENGYFVNYMSDRYGFNNQDEDWDSDTIEYLLLGDSLVHGFCVKQENNMTSLLKKISNKTVINLSYGGNGPLIQFASLKEFKPKNVRKIIWTYSEWNDLVDLGFEYNNPILKQYYLDKDYSQNLKKKQDIIDNIGNRIIKDSKKKNYLSEIKSKLKKFIFLNNTRFILSKKTKFYIYEKNFQILENILIKFIEFSEENNSIPYFVYIPSYDTFNHDINEVNYKKIKKMINKLDIKFIDIREEIAESKIDIRNLFPYKMPGHFSGEGYEFLMKKIYQKTN